MSCIKIKRVVSVTSEDTVNKANNLIDSSGVWATNAGNGSSKQILVLQLEKPSQIRQITVENNGSAFMEILVADKYDDNDEKEEEGNKFESLLPVVSFMSPAESKNEQNTSRVKRFTDESSSLNKEAAAKSVWQFVKIICTQPFNKSIQYGIRSIKFYDKPIPLDEETMTNVAAKINPGVFGLKKEVAAALDVNKEAAAVTKKDDDDDHEDVKDDKEETKKPGSVFAKWKNSEASKKVDDDQEMKDEDEENNKPPVGSNNLSPNKSIKHGYSSSKPPPRGQILKGVIFALSGFQNPLRSEIRDAGLRLGAKYRPDWTDDCTHLVCAFGNTPKVNVAKKAGGKIVNKDWIMDCEKNKLLLDWEGYQLEDDDDDEETKPRKAARNASKKINKLKDDLYDSHDEDSENSDDRDFIVNSSEDEDEEINDDDDDESMSTSSESESDGDGGRKRKKKAKKAKKSSKSTTSKKKESVKKSKKEEKPKKKKSDDDEESSEDDDLVEYKKQKEKEAIRKKLQEMKKSKSSSSSSESKKTKIEFDSEEEKPPTRSSNDKSSSKKKDDEEADDDWILPSFFTDKTFFIHNDLEAKRIKNLTRMIVAFGGNVSNYVTSEVGYVITEKEWNKEFDEGLKENKNLKFVNPDWIDACNRRKKLLAYQPFEIFPVDD